jgi:hypothetical protein
MFRRAGRHLQGVVHWREVHLGVPRLKSDLGLNSLDLVTTVNANPSNGHNHELNILNVKLEVWKH